MHAGYLQEARNRFATLLSLGPPTAVSEAIARQIAALDADMAAASAAAKASADTAIHLNIELAPALQGRVPAGASLFARSGEILNNFYQTWASVLLALKKGNFTARMPIGQTGLAGKISDALNDVIDGFHNAFQRRRAEERTRSLGLLYVLRGLRMTSCSRQERFKARVTVQRFQVGVGGDIVWSLAS